MDQTFLFYNYSKPQRLSFVMSKKLPCLLPSGNVTSAGTMAAGELLPLMKGVKN